MKDRRYGLLTDCSLRTLAGMFPDLDKDLIDDVVRVKEGRYVSLLQLHA